MKQVQERKPKHSKQEGYCVRCDYRVCPVHRNQDHGWDALVAKMEQDSIASVLEKSA